MLHEVEDTANNFFLFITSVPKAVAVYVDMQTTGVKLPSSPVKLTDEKAFCESCRDLPEREQKVMCEIQEIKSELDLVQSELMYNGMDCLETESCLFYIGEEMHKNFASSAMCEE